MQTQKDLVTMHDTHAIMNIDVLVLCVLLTVYLKRQGPEALPVLDDEGKNLILRKIAGNHENELQMLRGNIRKLGYISEVKSVLSEFAQYDIGEDEIERVMEVGRERRQDFIISWQTLACYIVDLRTIFGRTVYFQGRTVGRIKSCRMKIGTIKKQYDRVGWIYRISHRYRTALLGELMKHCRKVMSLSRSIRRKIRTVYEHPYQLFALSKQMVTSLLQLAKAK